MTFDVEPLLLNVEWAPSCSSVDGRVYPVLLNLKVESPLFNIKGALVEEVEVQLLCIKRSILPHGSSK